MNRREWLAAVGAALCAALCAALAVSLLVARAPQARAAGPPRSAQSQARHVVIVGVSGLTWNLVSKAGTPELWRLAAEGSVGSLVDYAQQPLACPADGWLTLNSAARAQGPRPCTSLPAVIPAGTAARIPAMPQIIQDNRQFHEAPDWGLLGALANCATAVGPGAALALASPAGVVASYLPSPADLSSPVLARCPLTVVDLTASSERVHASIIDRQLARLAAELPPGTLLLVTAPGAATAGSPHLMATVVNGPGFASGLLDSSSTRRPGIVTLTDLTPTVAAWLGHPVPAGTVGARITRAGRDGLGPTVTGLMARDTAEQVWISTHGWFFIGYALADLLAFCVPVLLLWGAAEERRLRRARHWRIAGIAAAVVPLASYLANLAPWWTWTHPAWWLYGLTIAWTLAGTAAALAGPWRRSALGPFGAICAATLLLLAVDVISGSRLQLDAPFGLSLLVSGRFYGIGNEALGIYCVCALVTAAWVTDTLRGRAPLSPRHSPEPWPWVLGVGVVGGFAVVASGWPGFGAKVGGTIALVPCLLLLAAWLAGARLGRGWVVPVAVSGLVVFLAFAVISYFLPGAGVSDMGTFAGNLLHGRGGDLLRRKVSSNVGSLTLNVSGWLIPVVALATGIALWQPAALRLRTLASAFAALPLLRVLAWLSWLVLVLGWFADDSGIIVPAVALPFVVPLTIAMASSELFHADSERRLMHHGGQDERVQFPRR
ncbi:MAG TPA: hypothetical protein VFO01_01925 [Trebonia sp.]|nr:hypothetical protein [Trebonia sp.]